MPTGLADSSLLPLLLLLSLLLVTVVAEYKDARACVLLICSEVVVYVVLFGIVAVLLFV